MPQQGQLTNGLRYTLLPLHSEKNHIEIRLKVYAGAVDEEDQQIGVAHMLEHLVFQATAKYPQGIMSYLHANHWERARHYNAVTTNDNTLYMFTIPPKSNLEQALDALSQMVFFAKLQAHDLDKERKIIMEEWRQGQGVGQRMNRQRTNIIRADSRYTRAPVIGTPESIASMPITQLKNFYQKWYTPNNMQLLIIGDINPQNTKLLIQKYFANIPAKKLPTRNYYEPKLTTQLRIAKLQDPQSGVSQVAYIFRMNEQKMREKTTEGQYLRLLDRISLALVTQRLKNQKSILPKGVESLVLRKADIGKNTVALGIFSSVDQNTHRLGLKQIFTEIQRLKLFPITEKELLQEKQKMENKIKSISSKSDDREFAQWVQTMNNTILQDKPYLPQIELAKIYQNLLPKITTEKVNQHIQSWFNAQDRIIQYQTPYSTPIKEISNTEIQQLLQEIEKNNINPPQPEKEPFIITFPKIEKYASILNEKNYPNEHVTYFYLANGDKLVWLKTDKAKDTSYFQAQSSAGYQANELNYWKSQIAVSLIMQNTPYQWKLEDLANWKINNKINLSAKQEAEKFIFSGSTPNETIAEFLQLYYAYQTDTKINNGIEDAKKQLTKYFKLDQTHTVEQEKNKTIMKLRYGDQYQDLYSPNVKLEQLSYQDINHEWDKIKSAPTTYYLVNNMDIKQIRDLIQKYLAPIQRNQVFQLNVAPALSGEEIISFPINLSPKDDISMWTFTPYKWSGHDAVLITLLQQIINQKLKQKLRDEQLSIYSLKFASKLNPNTQRIESELNFTANPEITKELISQVKTYLSNISSYITQEDVDSAKIQFLRSEKERIKSPYSWLSRLILSDQQYASPKYLTEINSLANNITLENIKLMANKIYHHENIKIFIATPIKQ